MKDFNDYAEKAIVRYGLTGYNNLAREIGIKKSSMSALRSGKTCPTEENMIKLAELAGLPKEEALIDLNLWRSKNKPELQKVWQRLAKMIGFVAGFLVLSSFDANACNFMINAPASHTTFWTENINYATKITVRYQCYK